MTLTTEWLIQFKTKTQEIWKSRDLDPDIFGFQIQRGTQWMPGLTQKEIDAYESDLGFKFDPDFKLFLSKMNGFDRPGLNVYGSSGEPHREMAICYSYPKDLAMIRNRIEDLEQDWDESIENLQRVSGLKLSDPVQFLPIFSHRYILCPPNHPVVCSIAGPDAIVFGKDLKSYLEREFLS